MAIAHVKPRPGKCTTDRFVVRLKVDGRRKDFGWYKTRQEAEEAQPALRRRHGLPEEPQRPGVRLDPEAVRQRRQRQALHLVDEIGKAQRKAELLRRALARCERAAAEARAKLEELTT